MGNEFLSKQAVLEESFVDEEVGFRDSAVLSRRDAIKKTLMTVAAISAMMLPIETLADEPVAADKDKEKKEAERKEIYDLVRKIGLYMIENKTPYTLKFYITGGNDLLFDMLKVRFKGEKSAMFVESWKVGDSKPYHLDTYDVKHYSEFLDIRYKGGWDVEQIG